MRDYELFIDGTGEIVRIPSSGRKLKFSHPMHANLRRYIFERDGYACMRCGVKAECPPGYNGRWAVRVILGASHDTLIVDHILTLKAGGTHRPSNLQALCETCNRKKIPEDNAATFAFRANESVVS